MAIDHRRFEDDLSAYLDGELQAGERAALEEHLPGCASCRGRLAELRETSAALKRHLLREAPAGLAARALAEARAPKRPWLRPTMGFAFAAAGVLLLVEAGRLRLGMRPAAMNAAYTEEALSRLPTGPALKTNAVPEPGQNAPPAAPPLAFDAAKALSGAGALPSPAAAPARRLERAAPRTEELGGAMGAPAGALTEPEEDSEPGVALEGRRPSMLKPDAAAAGKKSAAAFPDVMMPLPLRSGGAGGRAAPEQAAPLSPESRPAAQDAQLAAQEAQGMTVEEARAKEERESKQKGAENSAADRLEWSGTAARGPSQDERVVITDPSAWINFWPLHSSDPIPLIDFQKYMVVGVVAGPGSGWARIQSIETKGGKIVVRLLPRTEGGQAPAHTFHLKAIPRSDAPVEFAP